MLRIFWRAYMMNSGWNWRLSIGKPKLCWPRPVAPPWSDRRRVDGCWLNAAEVTEVVERLLAMSYQERIASPCIGAERADLVLAGCAILEAIRRAFPCSRLRVADRGLREGMLVQMMREDEVWAHNGGHAS